MCALSVLMVCVCLCVFQGEGELAVCNGRYEIITIILPFTQCEQCKGIPMMKQVFCERCHLAAELGAYEPGARAAERNQK